MLEQNEQADTIKAKLNDLLAHNQTERTKAVEAAEKKATEEQAKDEKKKRRQKESYRQGEKRRQAKLGYKPSM